MTHVPDVSPIVHLISDLLYDLPDLCLYSTQALLYGHMEQSMNDADWLLARIKSESSSTAAEELFGPVNASLGSQTEGLYSDLCERLLHLVGACSELAQTAVSTGPATEGLLKVRRYVGCSYLFKCRDGQNFCIVISIYSEDHNNQYCQTSCSILRQ